MLKIKELFIREGIILNEEKGVEGIKVIKEFLDETQLDIEKLDNRVFTREYFELIDKYIEFVEQWCKFSATVANY